MTTTARGTPEGEYLRDGFRTLIAFEDDPTVSFWEQTVQPPGIDGGDKIDITTMHNDDWRTFAARSLKTLTEISGTCLYDPGVYESILDLINKNGWITVHFPDESTLDFVGYLKDFIPAALVEGTPPTANYTIVPTNELNGSEVEPEYTSGDST
jgi:hypothetical protein